jgi:hypothetical protein
MKIHNLTVGDIFHAERPNGIRLIALVISVTETTIYARSAVNHQQFELDRKTGTGVVIFQGEQSPCAIYSTAPLPPDIRNTILGLDRKMRLEEDLERAKLSEAESKALLYVADNYSSQDGDSQSSLQRKVLRPFQTYPEEQ